MSVPDWLLAVQNYMKTLQYPSTPPPLLDLDMFVLSKIYCKERDNSLLLEPRPTIVFVCRDHNVVNFLPY